MPGQDLTETEVGTTPVSPRTDAEPVTVWRGDFQYCPACAQFVWVVGRNAVGQYQCSTCGAVTEERELPF